jgi:hypothetical protein
MINWKGCGQKRSWPNFKALFQQLPGGTDENHEKQHSRSPGRDLNPLTPKYEAGALTTRSRRSIQIHREFNVLTVVMIMMPIFVF